MNVPNPNWTTTSVNWLDVAKQAVYEHDCQQIPSELAAVLALLDTAVRPETILEIGGWAGGSAWAWSQLPSVSRVVTVTLPPGPPGTAKLRDGVGWTIILQDSQLADTAKRAKAATRPFGAGLVWIDGDHTDPAVRRDWDLYGPLVARGGLVAFHDINPVPQHPDCQVDLLWAELAAKYPSLSLQAAPGQIGGTGLLLR